VGKKATRILFISLPLVVILIQLFAPPQPPLLNRTTGLKKTVGMLVPPVEIILRYFDFNEKNALTSWEHKVFQGRVAYWVDLKTEADSFIPKAREMLPPFSIGSSLMSLNIPACPGNGALGNFRIRRKLKTPNKRTILLLVSMSFCHQIFQQFQMCGIRLGRVDT